MFHNHQRMCLGTPPRIVARGRHVALPALIILLSSTMLFFDSCKKEGNLKQPVTQANGPIAMRPDDDTLLELRIQSFYQQMNDCKTDPKSVAGELSIDSAEFLTEAAYNYYVARNSDDHVRPCYFEISNTTANSAMDITEVSSLFWQIKDSLLAVYNDISYREKKLSTFDLEITYESGVRKATVRASIADGPTPTCDYILSTGGIKSFSAGPDHVWSAKPLGATYTLSIPSGTGTNLSFIYGYGQSTIDMGIVPETLSAPQTLTLADAKSCLRSFGLNNVYGITTTLNQFLVNIHVASYNANANPNLLPVTNLPSPYHTINGFYDVPILMCDFSVATNQTINDSRVVVKTWLNTDLMNFYLGQIPSIVNSLIPPNKIGYDFNVGGSYPLGSFNFNNTYTKGAYVYDVSYGTPSKVKFPIALGITGF